jgi:hypothetical protein
MLVRGRKPSLLVSIGGDDSYPGMRIRGIEGAYSSGGEGTARSRTSTVFATTGGGAMVGGIAGSAAVVTGATVDWAASVGG